MARPTSLFAILAALVVCAPPGPAGIPTGSLVDLTHPFGAAAIYWPTVEGFVGHTVDEIPLDRFLGPARVLDVYSRYVVRGATN